MCELLDRLINEGLSEGLTRGRSEGRSEGRNEGRNEGLISTCKDFMLSYSETAAKLKEKYGLSDEEAEANMKLYW